MKESGKLRIPIDQPLVSVGIPTYNRPEGLRKTLECITGQTYKNLEIIVSDNCSPGLDTEIVVREFMAKDNRVQYYRQDENIGPLLNFQFVLEKTTGEYFMWAADDDLWIKSFIEVLTNELKKGPQYIAAMMECQYFDENQMFDFFEEGSPFYTFYSEDKFTRLKFMLMHNYGNLYYSLFRKTALYSGEESVFDRYPKKSLNEIPLLISAIEKGNWIVMPKIGMYKNTNIDTYRQALWETTGGKLPNINTMQYLSSLKGIAIYHLLATGDTIAIIRRLQVPQPEKKRLIRLAVWLLMKHQFSLIIRWK